jgi:hypothetical protein
MENDAVPATMRASAMNPGARLLKRRSTIDEYCGPLAPSSPKSVAFRDQAAPITLAAFATNPGVTVDRYVSRICIHIQKRSSAFLAVVFSYDF